jgi:hypothetical protein
MRPNHLDEDSAARMLQGTVHPDDAPPGYGSVAGLLVAAASLPTVDEDAGAATISAMVETIRAGAPVPETSRRKAMIGKLLAGKALAVIAVVGLTATGAAAATGSLPDPAQGVVSDAASHVGVNIPHPNHGKSAGHRQDGKHRPDGNGNDAGQGQDQPDNHGQVTSDAAHTAKDAAKDAGQKVGPAVCVEVGSQCGKNKPAGSDDESGEPGKSGEEHGKSGEEHGTTPTTGSIATGEENSGRDLPSGTGRPTGDE